jgi:hypothetical protein
LKQYVRRSVAPRVCALFAAAALCATADAQSFPLPRLDAHNGVTQLFVDGKPLILFSGELHNSSPSSTAYMAPIWDRLEQMHLNAVIGAASWELIEPEEHTFDFATVDDQIVQARAHHMRLVLIWFGSFKNANSTYLPMWVKRNQQRFPMKLAKNPPSAALPLRTTDALTAFSEQNVAADANAFAALMQHLRQFDTAHTVVMMQVENETGVRFDSRDRSPLAEAAYNTTVPAELMDYLQAHEATLLPELQQVWQANGHRTKGTWPEIFGSNPAGDEVFMAWYIARYVQRVAQSGKKELDLPMYANAWLVQFEGQTPGDYPSGGPVSRMMDIWHAAAPSIALQAPDIYLNDFADICASYTRQANPLFIPEARANVANLFLAIARFNAIGYSPFGIDSLRPDDPLTSAYATLANMVPELAAAQQQHNLALIEPLASGDRIVQSDGYDFHISYGYRGSPPPAPKKAAPAAGEPPEPTVAPEPVAFLQPFRDQRRGVGVILPQGNDTFFVIGTGLSLMVGAQGTLAAHIGTVDEGVFNDGKWLPGRRLNGDETFGNTRIVLDSDAVSAIKITLFRGNP